MAESSPPTVGIIGAGTMGAGIAQVAATSGWVVELMDVDEPTVRAAIDGIGRRLDRLVEKGRLAPEKRD
ncbi:MAG: 3-hydroxybutyryl-CoA dehydrogenase, partial [Planctomycetes bacterium]|nr:3-hydroxybutyryl-CoA dehydrogenase [Planctomycetota bacterium]